METKKDLEKTKKTYKISDLMAKVNVTARTIRYYDSEGLLGEVKRSVGFTRYFTDDDICRIKEILKLKKKGFKIAKIKALFKEKYSQTVENTYKNIAVSDVFLTEKDVTQIQALGIEIVPSDLVFDSVKMPYLQWKNLKSKIEKQPYKVHASKNSNRQNQWAINQSNQWLGNMPRGIVHYILKHHSKSFCTEKKILELSNQSYEWLIMPLEIKTNINHHELNDSYYFIQYRSKDNVEENIWKRSVLLANIEKQVRAAIAPFNGLMNQVTIHSKKSNKSSSKIVTELSTLFPNQTLVNIEDLSPYYQYESGSISTIYLSII